MTTVLRTLRNYIGRESLDAADGRTIEIVNPMTGEPYATSPLSGRADVDAAKVSNRNDVGQNSLSARMMPTSPLSAYCAVAANIPAASAGLWPCIEASAIPPGAAGHGLAPSW